MKNERKKTSKATCRHLILLVKFWLRLSDLNRITDDLFLDISKPWECGVREYEWLGFRWGD